MSGKLDIDGIGMTSQRARNRLADRLAKEGIHHAGVLDALRTTPRHIFIDEALAHRAYDDTPLPIGHGQTISQPYIVATMTQALVAEGKPQRVLEVGTGSGYQTSASATPMADSVGPSSIPMTPYWSPRRRASCRMS